MYVLVANKQVKHSRLRFAFPVLFACCCVDVCLCSVQFYVCLKCCVICVCVLGVLAGWEVDWLVCWLMCLLVDW